MAGLTAFVLAGGRSSRMGADKALLPLGDLTLLERALRMVNQVASESYIVGPRDRYERFGEVAEDIFPGCGPLAGIHAALTNTRTDLNLILSVDMPIMTTSFLSWLIQTAVASEALMVVPEAAGGLQPLCATYRRGVAAIAERALREGDYKVGHLFSQAPTRILSEQEIVAAGFSPEIFRNINTPEEYARCQ